MTGQLFGLFPDKSCGASYDFWLDGRVLQDCENRLFHRVSVRNRRYKWMIDEWGFSVVRGVFKLLEIYGSWWGAMRDIAVLTS